MSLDDANEMLQAIEGMAIKTTQGSFVRVEDLKGLYDRKEDERRKQKEQVRPRSFNEAKVLIKQDSELLAAIGPQRTPQSPSRA